MFSISESITDLKVKDRSIFKILYSMNSHPVALPDMATEEARCYILFFSDGPNISSFIGLYLPRVDKRFFYTYTSNPFPYEAANDVEEEARAFAEDMGFLLDEINVNGMAAEDRNHWIEEQFIFGYKKPETEQKTDEPAARKETKAKEPDRPAAVPAAEKSAAAPAAASVQKRGEDAAPSAPAAPQPAASVQQPLPAVAAPQPPAAQPPVTAMPQPPQQQMPQGQPPAPGYPPYPPQPSQPAGYPQVQPGYPQQQPAGYPPPGYPAYPPQQAPQGMPSAPGYPPPYQQMAPPVLEHPVEIPEERPRQKSVAPPKGSAKKKPPAAKAVQPPPSVEVDQEIAAEVQYEEVSRNPQGLFEEAIRQGVVRPVKPKAGSAAATGPSGVVPRDKEALARLLASF